MQNATAVQHNNRHDNIRRTYISKAGMLRHLVLVVVLLAMAACGCAQSLNGSAAQQTQANRNADLPSTEGIADVSPALAQYTENLYSEVWNRPGLSKRDRSLVTVSALIASGQPWAIGEYVDQALDNGVKPAELSELITHLAFYCGWGNALAAIEPTREVFAKRGIKSDELPAATVNLLPLNEDAESKRAAFVQTTFGSVSPGVVHYTTTPLFREQWLRPALAPRDRSLVTVSALIASGQAEQVTFHLNKAMDNGLTQEEAGEVLTQLAFYAGWPRVFSAMPVVKNVFESRLNRE